MCILRSENAVLILHVSDRKERFRGQIHKTRVGAGGVGLLEGADRTSVVLTLFGGVCYKPGSYFNGVKHIFRPHFRTSDSQYKVV